MNTQDRYRGALVGLAVGDALGTTLEFKPPGTFKPVTDITGGGPFHLKLGQWTDDTSMALCLAESLAEKCGFQLVQQLSRGDDGRLMFVLEKAGLLERRQDGGTQSCALTPFALSEASQWIEHYRHYWTSQLDGLAGFVEGQAEEE